MMREMMTLSGAGAGEEQDNAGQVDMINAVTMIQANFVQPTRQLTLMLAVTLLTGLGCYVFWPVLARIFVATPYLNGLITGVFFIGVLSCFWQIIQIYQSVSWLDKFSSTGLEGTPHTAPRLLAPLTSLLEQTDKSLLLPSVSARSILDSISSRMDESRDISRYIANLLIFLGLLGTFFGLATTVPAVLDAIQALSPAEGTTALSMFEQLMQGVETQLAGMGVAFSSSLLGLAGSLVVGLLDLFAGHGQNRFYRGLEEWISTMTKLDMSSSEGQSGTTLGIIPERSTDSALVYEIRLLNESIRAVVQENLTTTTDLENGLVKLAQAIDMQTQVRRDEPVDFGAIVAQLASVTESQAEVASYLQNVALGIADQENRILLQSIEALLLRIASENAGIRETLVRIVHSEPGDDGDDGTNTA